MSRVGYALIILGLIGGWSIRIFAPDYEDAYAVAGLVLLAGTMALVIDGGRRITQGKVKLRPLDALRKAAALFLLIMSIRTIIWILFPRLGGDAASALLQSAAFAIGYGLYTTAYRKPA